MYVPRIVAAPGGAAPRAGARVMISQTEQLFLRWMMDDIINVLHGVPVVYRPAHAYV